MWGFYHSDGLWWRNRGIIAVWQAVLKESMSLFILPLLLFPHHSTFILASHRCPISASDPPSVHPISYSRTPATSALWVSSSWFLHHWASLRPQKPHQYCRVKAHMGDQWDIYSGLWIRTLNAFPHRIGGPHSLNRLPYQWGGWRWLWKASLGASDHGTLFLWERLF